MPPRKIDSAKRGDVSMAQFVVDSDTERRESASAAPPHLKAAPSSSTSNTPATQMEMDDLDPADASLLGDKDKEKERDKERDRKDKDAVTVEDLTLPKSIIQRLAKGVLPSNTQIQANATLAMSKSATLFINHIANAANEHTLNNNKKTIMPADVFAALDDIEFPFFRERLEAEFKKFNDVQTSKRNTYRRKIAAQKKGEKPDADPNASLVSNASAATATERGGPDAPRSKKQKPNAAHEESAMDIDGDGDGDEAQDASDAETEPDQEHDDDDDEDNAEEEEEEEEDDEGNGEEEHDRLEERQKRDDDDDDALENDGDSD
ncbi:histone-fold-containing protein [Astrocystis sublimbata]|nr:histone-fold-containing protein [Astrocystis sublimbata]